MSRSKLKRFRNLIEKKRQLSSNVGNLTERSLSGCLSRNAATLQSIPTPTRPRRLCMFYWLLTQLCSYVLGKHKNTVQHLTPRAAKWDYCVRGVSCQNRRANPRRIHQVLVDSLEAAAVDLVRGFIAPPPLRIWIYRLKVIMWR